MLYPDHNDFITRYTENLFDELRENFNRCKEEINVTLVHDCRVSLRRLMALIEVLSSLHADEKKTLIKNRKALKKLQKRFSPTRDVHVLKKYISDNIVSLCDSNSFLEWLTSQTANTEETLMNDLKEIKFSDILRIKDNMFRLFLKNTSEISLTDSLFTILDDIFLETVEKIEKLDLGNLVTFHSVRISLKRFRYTLEILNQFDSAYQMSLFDLKNLQDYLGEIQDLSVLKHTLMNCSPDLKNEFEYDCMLDFINEKLTYLTNSFYNQRYEVLKLWEIKT